MGRHEFRLFGEIEKHPVRQKGNIKEAAKGRLNQLKAYIELIFVMHKAEKIILHSLFNPRVTIILWVMPWLLKKCYWVIWGGDLYTYSLSERTLGWHKNEFFRRSVIKNMKGLVTYIKGDYELAQKWYKAKGQYCECLMYPSNLYKEHETIEKHHEGINIQVGNSAASSNKHLEVFDSLKKHKEENIKIFAPLSYGDKKYAAKVVQKGKELFGEKFHPMTDFMPFNGYLKFLGEVDIAIFAHKRQQAMGNTITLLGLGKKVYIRSDITPWAFFNKVGLKVFDAESIDLNVISQDEKEINKNKVKEYFSEENYLKQLKSLFDN